MMSVIGFQYYKQHFLFSNQLVQFFLGFDQYRSPNQQLVLLYIVTVYTLPMIVHQFYQLFTSDFELRLTVSVLQRTMAPLSILCCYSVTYCKFNTMQKIVICLKSYYNRISDNIEMKTIEKYTTKSKMYAYFIVGIFNIYIFLMISPSILNIVFYLFGKLDYDQLTLPYSVNHALSAWLYYCLLIYQIIAIYVLAIVACTCFSVYLVAVQHACCQFSIIILKTIEPFEDHRKKFCYYKTSREEFDWIVDIIKRLREVTEFVKLLNAYEIIYCILILFALVFIVLDFLYMFQLKWSMRNISELFDCIIYSIGSIFITYINFYVGQMLINHSNVTYKELCQVPYYALSIKTQKLLLLVIARSEKPSILSIGGMFVSSHQVFSKMMQKAFSFSMVYYNIQ